MRLQLAGDGLLQGREEVAVPRPEAFIPREDPIHEIPSSVCQTDFRVRTRI